jgi:hypothetical protein
MIPLEIICKVETPIIYHGDGMNLDGILAYGYYRQLSREDKAKLPPINGPIAVDFPLPVKRWQAPAMPNIDANLLDASGLLWGWHTSDVQAEWQGRQKHALRGKTDASYMTRHTDETVVNIGSGEFKGKNQNYEAWWPNDGILRWYACGEPEELTRLLGWVTNLGKLNNHGLGKVSCDLDGSPYWLVHEIGEDKSIGHRPMPVGCPGRTGHPKLVAIRAPRHHRSRFVPCH